MDVEGKLYGSNSNYHPDERDLQMTAEHVLAFDQAISDFGSFAIYSTQDDFVLVNTGNILRIIGGIAIVCVIVLALLGFFYIRRRRKRVRLEPSL